MKVLIITKPTYADLQKEINDALNYIENPIDVRILPEPKYCLAYIIY